MAGAGDRTRAAGRGDGERLGGSRSRHGLLGQSSQTGFLAGRRLPMDGAGLGGLVPGGSDFRRKLLDISGILLSSRLNKVLGEKPDMALHRAVPQPMPLGLPRRFDRACMAARLQFGHYSLNHFKMLDVKRRLVGFISPKFSILNG